MSLSLFNLYVFSISWFDLFISMEQLGADGEVVMCHLGISGWEVIFIIECDVILRPVISNSYTSLLAIVSLFFLLLLCNLLNMNLICSKGAFGFFLNAYSQ